MCIWRAYKRNGKMNSATLHFTVFIIVARDGTLHHSGAAVVARDPCRIFAVSGLARIPALCVCAVLVRPLNQVGSNLRTSGSNTWSIGRYRCPNSRVHKTKQLGSGRSVRGFPAQADAGSIPPHEQIGRHHFDGSGFGEWASRGRAEALRCRNPAAAAICAGLD
jgi:hypothetical protein